MEGGLNKQLRNKIRNTLENLLTENFKITPEREKEISNHVDECLSEFGNELKNIALKRNHPYVRYYLESALSDLKKDIDKGGIFCQGIDEMLLNPELEP